MDVKLLPSYHSKVVILLRVPEIIYISYHSIMLCHLVVSASVAFCHKMMCQLSFPYKKFQKWQTIAKHKCLNINVA
jgi:hypothetical protein